MSNRDVVEQNYWIYVLEAFVGNETLKFEVFTELVLHQLHPAMCSFEVRK